MSKDAFFEESWSRVANGIPQKRHDPGCEGTPCSCESPQDRLYVEGHTILARAEAAVSGPRQEAYGPPGVNHARTALLWGAYLEAVGVLPATPITAEMVAWMNVLQKISREIHSKTDDGLVDVAGYVRNIEMLRGAR